ncbi:hypothetical protein HZA55_08560 [Candidatus Poribacteria bacterium]|nr:hypothetical protein [Candidatus Poribacteria bacterium]
MRYFILRHITEFIDRFKLHAYIFFYVTIGILLAAIVMTWYIKKKSMKKVSIFIYFFSIGCGFIIVELFFLQRLSIVFGNPIENNPIILFIIISSCGIGAIFSKRFSNRKNIILSLLLIVFITFFIGLLMEKFYVNLYQSTSLTYPILIFFIIFATSVLLGFIFSSSMKLFTDKETQLIPTPILLAVNAFGYIWGGFLSLYLAPEIGYNLILSIGSFIYLISLGLVLIT